MLTQEQKWQQVAGLHPRLRSHVSSSRHKYRGQVWYVLSDLSSGRHMRYPQSAHFLVAAMDGHRSVAEIVAAQADAVDCHHPLNSEQAARLLSELHSAGLLQSEMGMDAKAQYARSRAARLAIKRQKWLRPMMLRFPLWDPDHWLNSSIESLRFLFSRPAFLIWLLLVIAGVAAAGIHWADLLEHAAARAMDPVNLLLLWLCYPVVKALHEFGHAYATKAWGGEVHEMGVMLLVFVPVPYVDASAASRFSSKTQRMLVGAMGIMVELMLAAVAVLLWTSLQPGLLRDLAFNVAVIGGVSTLLFNGNPLLRFDGYYVLADLVEIPNLAARSNQYLYYLAQRYLFGLPQPVSPVQARGERAWFVFYGLLSAAYRLIIGISIALYVASRFFFLGVVLAVIALFTQLLLPLLKLAGYLSVHPQLQGRRRRALVISTAALVLLPGLAWMVPVPYSTYAEGLVQLPEAAIVRATEAGFVTRMLQPHGAMVTGGMPLLALESPRLSTQARQQQARVAELQAMHASELVNNPGLAQAIASQLDNAKQDYRELLDRRSRLQLVSHAPGAFNPVRGADLPGRFVHKGQVVGYVTPPEADTVRVAIPQAVTELVRHQTLRVEILVPGQQHQVLQAHLQREVPLVHSQLPDRRLGSNAGGAIAVDSRDQEGLHAMQPIYQFDVRLDDQQLPGFFQERVYVRFVHAPEPLAQRWIRGLRRLFLARLNV